MLKTKNLKEYHKQYYQNNKEKIHLRAKEWALKNKEKVNKRKKDYYNKQKFRIKAYYLKATFGITLKQYDEMFEKQNGLCAICFKKEQRLIDNIPVRLSVDHNHATGKIRALLCGLCNKGIGNFKDNIDLLKNAIEYLKKFEINNNSSN